MFLEKIEVKGFKSFSAKTIFSFREKKAGENSVTAIVGSNGTGKSNIADAIRFVMGEQSMKILRGKKNEDLIFCGGESSHHQSFAYVRMTIDNSSGRIPIKNSQVEIERRIYRDGTNDYLINGASIRLFDLQRMLAKSGFGQRNYAVVGQGMVDRLLLTTMRERRDMFDEATGVKEFQLKKEYAIKKLSRTKENLEKIELSLSSMKPRVRMLKREAKKIQARKELESEFKKTAREYFSCRYKKVFGSIKDIKKSQEDVSQKLSEVDDGMKLLSSELRFHSEVISREEEKYESLQYEKERIFQERESLSQEVSKCLLMEENFRHHPASERASLLRKKIEDAKENILDLEKKIAENKKILVNDRTDNKKVSQISNRLIEMRKILKEKEKNLFIRDKECALLEKKKIALSERLKLMTEHLLDDKMHPIYFSKLQDVQEKISENTREANKKREEIQKHRLEMEHILKEEGKLVNRYASLEESLDELDERKAGIFKKIAFIQKKLKKILDTFESLFHEKREFREKIEEVFQDLGTVVLVDEEASFSHPNSLEKLEEMKKEIQNVKDEIEKVRVKKQEEEITLVKFQHELSSIENEIEKLRAIEKRFVESREDKDVLGIQSEIEKNNYDIREKSKEREAVEKDYKGLETQIKQAEEEYHKITMSKQFEHDQKEEKQKLLALELEQVRANVRSFRQELSSAEQELANHSEAKRIDEIFKKRENFQKKIALLSEKTRKLSGTEKSVSLLLRETRKKHAVLTLSIEELEDDEDKFQNMKHDADVAFGKLEVQKEEFTRKMHEAGFTSDDFNKKEDSEYNEDVDFSELSSRYESLQEKLSKIGEVDLEIQLEYEEVEKKYEFLESQKNDLFKAREDLVKIIHDLDEEIAVKFSEKFDSIDREFNKYFRILFGGGSARLSLVECKNERSDEKSQRIEIEKELDKGEKVVISKKSVKNDELIDIRVTLPGKNVSDISLLSGGEKALTSIALLLGIISTTPPPFCVLDEVDAALDESNSIRFSDIIKNLSAKTQFIIITHNRNTMRIADSMYGVTMEEKGVSKVVSVSL